jgi:hypothetical protein
MASLPGVLEQYNDVKQEDENRGMKKSMERKPTGAEGVLQKVRGGGENTTTASTMTAI